MKEFYKNNKTKKFVIGKEKTTTATATRERDKQFHGRLSTTQLLCF